MKARPVAQVAALEHLEGLGQRDRADNFVQALAVEIADREDDRHMEGCAQMERQPELDFDGSSAR